MKLATTFLPLAAVSTAFVIPDEQLTNQMLGEAKQISKSFYDRLSEKTHDIYDQVEDVISSVSSNSFDLAISAVDSVNGNYFCQKANTAFDGQGWLDSADNLLGDIESSWEKHSKQGHHGHHGHHKPNRTVYELINESKYTTKLASHINEFPDLVDVLNGTAANYTVFAPTDKAFEKLSEHFKPSKEEIKWLLAYHVSPEFYPAGRVLVTHTIPTTYGETHLNGQRQRLRVGLGLKGLTVNFYARIIAINIFGTNGVIHGIDHLLFHPPQTSKILTLLPSEFSTLTLGLEKTGLFEKLTSEHHYGGTLFAPSNWAFQKLGPKINMFLFSEHGKKSLEALLKYHIVPDQTLYSDAFYPTHNSDNDANVQAFKDIPKGKYHVDLKTLLEDKSLSIDIARFGGFISFKINGFADVSTQDGIAKDGVIQELSTVLIPPKTPGGQSEEATADMSVEELVERLEGYRSEL